MGTSKNFVSGASDPLSAAAAQRSAESLQMVRTALQTKNVMLAYQPVVSARNFAQPAFFEGLIRVLDNTGRVIPAREFIYDIENTEEGRKMDCLALEMGLKMLAANPGMRLSINMSAKSIGYPLWEIALDRGLFQQETVAERLILEITESSTMEMPDLVVDFMDRIQARGISFALDDFGAGYTAFRYFKDFMFDLVKIDGTFIKDIDVDTDNQVLTRALVSIAQQFDMFTVAEYVETEREAWYLAENGIDCLQGYLFGAPAARPHMPEALPSARTASA